MKKVWIPAIILLLVLASLGVAQALWSQTLTTNVTTSTGAWSTTLNLDPTAASDKTGVLHNFNTTELAKLAADDGQRYTTVNSWSYSYDDMNHYLEFKFSHGMTAGSIDSVNLNFIWTPGLKITNAKAIIAIIYK